MSSRLKQVLKTAITNARRISGARLVYGLWRLLQLLGLVAQYAANVWQLAEVGFGVVQAFVGRDADGEAVQDGIVVENFCAVSGDVLA